MVSSFLSTGTLTSAAYILLRPKCDRCWHFMACLPHYQQTGKDRNLTNMESVKLVRVSNQKNMPSVDFPISDGNGSDNMSALMLYYAENGLFLEARVLWSEIVNSSIVPKVEVVSSLVNAYARMGQYEEVSSMLHEITLRGFDYCHEIYSVAVCCFGKSGKLDMMEGIIKEMVSKGFKVDSPTGNVFLVNYSLFGSISDMEYAYQRLKKSRILIEKESIRAMASAYISERKFYKLGEFLMDVGLGRRNTGNLLWNLLLLSYAANFKMKSLQREFLGMVSAGFSPDLTTFNIRSLAFSRMNMFWDLHLSINHMIYEGVVPDLVTYGCIIDTYLNRKLGKNLSFALHNMNVDSIAMVSTDPLVYEVFGKGDFHSSSEVLIESTAKRRWTYAELISRYIKRQYRSNQIFWNY